MAIIVSVVVTVVVVVVLFVVPNPSVFTNLSLFSVNPIFYSHNPVATPIKLRMDLKRGIKSHSTFVELICCNTTRDPEPSYCKPQLMNRTA